MSRLIDADDVKKRGDCYPPEVRSVISNILRHTKTIKDVAPVKHGHWIWDELWNLGAWKCSECYCVNHNLGGMKNTIPLEMAGSKYCPTCGARMDEVSK